ncbi:MAG: HugZ family protein [Rhizobiaceae bacterium]|nr:HugZ family protein [Rhizobiaceae bacterium]
MTDGKKDVLRPTDEEAIALARRLMRSARYGSLAVIDPESGAPLATRVAVATDMDGAPVILVSSLSAHTGGLQADERCSLLLGEPGKGDPLAHPRISIACDARQLQGNDNHRERIGRRFLNKHPKAKLYAGFADFSYFRLEPRSASLNGGFGKAYALGRSDLLVDSAANEALAAAEQSAVSHMNADHRDAINVYARAFAGAREGDWTMTGIDAEGIDLACGDDVVRVLFPQPLSSASAMRAALVKMAADGRKKLETNAIA